LLGPALLDILSAVLTVVGVPSVVGVPAVTGLSYVYAFPVASCCVASAVIEVLIFLTSLLYFVLPPLLVSLLLLTSLLWFSSQLYLAFMLLLAI